MLTGLLSNLALHRAQEVDESDAILKGAALLYARVACWAQRQTLTDMVDRITAGLTTQQKKALRSCFVSTLELDPSLKTFYSSGVVHALDEWANSNEVIEPDEFGPLIERFLEEKQKPTHELLSLYLSVRFACPFHAHPDEVPKLQKLFRVRDENNLSEHTPLRVSLPDLDKLSWSDILELRKSRYLDKYRLFVSTFHFQSDADVKIAAEINEALWTAIGSLQPTPSGSALKRLIGQVPMPFSIPNPYSVYRDVKDGVKEAKLYRNYGWLWFVQEAKTLAQDANHSK